MFGDPITNKNDYATMMMSEAVDKGIIEKPLDGNHGEKHPKSTDVVNSGIPFIMANNLIDGKVDLVNCAYITRKQAESLDKGFAKNGDVLITHKGTIGRTAILNCKDEYVILAPQVTYYRPIVGICAEYLREYFNSAYFQSVIHEIAREGSTRAYISVTAQMSLKLMVPPIERQKEFTSYVKSIDKLKFEAQEFIEKSLRNRSAKQK